MAQLQKSEGFPGQRIVVLPKWVVSNALQQPLLSDLLLTDVGFFPRAAGHLRERPTGVEQAIFIYCSNGSGWCEVGGHRHSVKRGELLIIPPRASHAYGADEITPWSIFWFHATGAGINPLLDELNVNAGRPLLFVGQNPRLPELFNEAISAVEQGYSSTHLLYATRTLGHLLGLMVWERKQKWRSETEPRQKMEQSIAYMKKRLNQPLKVSQLAASVNLSASHYSALFKSHTGFAPMDYFIRLRMHQASQLLDNTDMNVKQIASALGYDDPFYFSRAFKSVNDISPTEYRLLHKG